MRIGGAKYTQWSAMVGFAMALSGCGSAPKPVAESGSLRLSVSPSSGQGNHGIFSLSVKGGGSEVVEASLLINSMLDGQEACYVIFRRAENGLLLVRDSGSGSMALDPKTGFVENGHCRISLAGPPVETNETEFTMRVDVAFLASFQGQKKIFAGADAGAHGKAELREVGTWAIPAP